MCWTHSSLSVLVSFSDVENGEDASDELPMAKKNVRAPCKWVAESRCNKGTLLLGGPSPRWIPRGMFRYGLVPPHNLGSWGTCSFPQTSPLQNQHDNLYLILLGCFGPETSLLYEMNQSETLQNGFETLQNEPETLQHEPKTLQNVSETKRARTYLEKLWW